jgi:GNAT superfamily N-acetyltransferase
LSAPAGAHRAEVRSALDAGYAEMFASLQSRSDGAVRLEMVSGVRCTRSSGIDEPGWSLYLNQAAGLGVGQPATEQAVDDVLGFYGPGRRPFIVALDPDARPFALAGWLEARGLRRRLVLARSQRAPETMSAPEGPFRIEDIGPDRADTYASVAAPGLPASVVQAVAALAGQPGWTHSIAYDGDTPVAGAALFLSEGVACLGWSATHPAHRRRGAHGALIAHRLSQAAARGCKVVAAETLEPSSSRPGAALRNLVRAGFQPGPEVRVYVG